MKYEAKDVKETQTCKNDHKYQYIEVDKKGYFWQYCTGCDRKLLMR
jgi:hypothetical protein